MIDVYRKERDITDFWKSSVNNWIVSNGQVLIIVRHLRAAGRKDWGIFQSYDRLMTVIEGLPIGADVIAVQRFEIKFKGKLSASVIDSANDWFNDDQEYLIIGLDRVFSDLGSITGTDGIGQKCLIDDLADFVDENVVVGLCPPYSAEDNISMISFSKGGIDGPR